jgi:hypothetical protein
LVVTDVQSGKQVTGVDVARQWFKPIPDEVGLLRQCCADADKIIMLQGYQQGHCDWGCLLLLWWVPYR